MQYLFVLQVSSVKCEKDDSYMPDTETYVKTAEFGSQYFSSLEPVVVYLKSLMYAEDGLEKVNDVKKTVEKGVGSGVSGVSEGIGKVKSAVSVQFLLFLLESDRIKNKTR